MNHRTFFVVAIILMAMVVPSMAYQMNLSRVVGGTITAETLDSFRSSGSPTYEHTFPEGNTLNTMTLEPTNEDTYRIYLNRADGSQFSLLASYIWATSVSGTSKIEIDGGSNTSTWYAKVPAVSNIFGQTSLLTRSLVVFVGINTYDKKEYLVGSYSLPILGNNGDYVSFDTGDVAMIEITDRISQNPITSMAIYSSSDFTATGSSISTANFKDGEDQAEQTVCTGLLCQVGLGWFETSLKTTYDLLQAMLSGFSQLLAVLSAFATWLFIGGLFIGLNVCYIGFAIVLSIEDSSDLFKAFSKFMRYMHKLMEFYMGLYKNIKSLIQWW